jgi:hypothetical protein
LIQNSQGQPCQASSALPTVEPIAGASTTTMPIVPIIRPIRPGPAAMPSSICPTGTSRPPHRPSSTRAAISCPAVAERAHATDATVNSARLANHSWVGPTRRAAQAQIGIEAARASR